MTWVYRDRAQAGEVLARWLAGYASRDDVIVLALPRGGVPVAYPVAVALDAPLGIVAVRKLGVPGHEELAMGAIAADGVRVLNHQVLDRFAIDAVIVAAVTRTERERLIEQQQRFESNRSAVPREGRRVVLVDDGLATGSTMEAAIMSCRQAGAAGIVVAVPIGAPETVVHLKTLADEVVCPATPADFRAVGLAYGDFAPVTDSEVVALLDTATRP